MRTVLAWIAKRLDEPAWSADETKVSGRFDGRRVSIELRSTNEGGAVIRQTLVDVATEPGVRVLLHVRRGKRQGTTATLELGDPEFDRAFVVEGAPERTARALLDAEVRRALLESGAEQLFTTGDGYRLLASRYVEDPAKLLPMVRAAARVETLAEAVRAENLLADAGAGYRGSAALAARDHEAMTELAALRLRRDEAERRRKKLVLTGAGAVFVVLFVFGLLARI